MVSGTLTALAGEAWPADRQATPPGPPLPRAQPGEGMPGNPPLAEVTFARLQRFLVVTEAGSQRQRLYGTGEVLTDAGDAAMRWRSSRSRLRASNCARRARDGCAG